MPDIEIIVDSAIGTCATHIDEITSVANNLTNINSVKDNAGNINTVASNISDINAVGANILNVNAVADDLTKIDTVYSALGVIDTVYTKRNDITTVAGIATDVTTVAGIKSDILAVESNSGDIDTVSSNITKVNAVGDNILAVIGVYNNITSIITSNLNSENINTVSSNITNVNTVAGISSAVSTVAGISSAVSAVSSNSTNINAVAGNATNINAVNSNKTNIDTVASNDTNITTCATNISAITSAPTYANSASNSAGIATSQAQIATQQANLARQYAEETHGQSDVMVENVRAIPAYENYGYTQTESKGLEDLKKFNRSTFDSSKFTVVGTPKVTDDGIVSGFSSVNFVKKDDLSIAANKTFVIKGKIKTGSNITDDQAYLGINQSGSTAILLENRVSGGNLVFIFATGETANASFTIPCSVNTEYSYEISYNGTSLIYTINGIVKSPITTFYSANFGYIYLGRSREGAASGYSIGFKGSIDLKKFSITVDGVEIFNGNKTGVDVIKADDFVVEGSPAISDKGIASGFSTSNYLTKENAVTIGSSGEFHIDFKCIGTQATTLQNILDVYDTTGNEIVVRRNQNSDTYQCLGFVSGVAVFNVSANDTSNNITGYVEYKNGVYTFDINGAKRTVTSTTKPNALTYDLSLGIRLFNPSDLSPYINGSIDLNALKIYIDDQLVYQPCLKIPYNRSKTGLKIVQSAYRDRVQDMYNQYGWANYYTLSDTDFTLPMGENLDGHVTKVDWYKNGVTSWEYDTNLDCVETGNCTSGTAVTLPKPMADDTYSLSVPYSAKSKTGFTPTQTGDYIAKGKVVLG